MNEMPTIDTIALKIANTRSDRAIVAPADVISPMSLLAFRAHPYGARCLSAYVAAASVSRDAAPPRRAFRPSEVLA